MACYHPLTAYRTKGGRDSKTGKWPLTFNVKNGYSDMAVTVPCGQCIGCRLEKSRQWAIRCVHESSLYDRNCFLTLTYDNAHLPEDGSLNKRDIQLFLKRLRKQYGDGIRFFQCGEYGSLCTVCGNPEFRCICKQFSPGLGRPHHHAIIFNFDFDDKKIWSSRQGVRLYRSVALERLWPFGFCTIGEVNFESAAYVARYVTKKITGDNAALHYGGRLSEFITMSRRPGIAREWFNRFSADVYNYDTCVVRPGLIARPPKYYDNLYDVQDSEDMRRIKAVRRRKAEESADDIDRRAVREKVQFLKAKKLIRPYEGGCSDV